MGGLLLPLRTALPALLSSNDLQRMNARSFIAAILYRNNERTLRPVKRLKKLILYALLGNPLILRAIECLKHCNRIWVGGWSPYNGGKARVSGVASPTSGSERPRAVPSGPEPRRARWHTIPPFYFIISTQWKARKGVGWRQYARRQKTTRKSFMRNLLSQNKIGCKLK